MTQSQHNSVAAYIGAVLKSAIEEHPINPVDGEPFSAVGQWGSVAGVGLVLTAAVISEISQRPEPASNVNRDEEAVTEEWDHRCGYAS